MSDPEKDQNEPIMKPNGVCLGEQTDVGDVVVRNGTVNGLPEKKESSLSHHQSNGIDASARESKGEPPSFDELSDCELPPANPEMSRLPSEQNKPDVEEEKPFESRMLKLLGMGFPFSWCEEALSSHPPSIPVEEVVDFLLARSFQEPVPSEPGPSLPPGPSDATPMVPPLRKPVPPLRRRRSESPLRKPVPPLRRRRSFASSTTSSSAYSPQSDWSDEEVAIKRQRKLREQQQEVLKRLASLQQSSVNDENEHAAPHSSSRLALAGDDSKRFDAQLRERDDAEVKEDGERKFACMICFDDVRESDFLSMGKCGHGQCKDCLLGHYRSLITDGKVKFTCVQPSCSRAIKEEEVMVIIDQDVTLVQKYKRFKRNHAMASNPNGRWCSAPGCDTPIIGKKGDRKLVCPTCQAETCFRCALPFHRGNCNSEIDKKYHKWAKGRNVRKCPKCSARVQKDGGCNHMRCPRCLQQWCWLCGSKYRGSNHYSEWNPIGCRGRQFDELNDRMSCCTRLFRYSFWLVCCPIACMCCAMEACDCDFDDCCDFDFCCDFDYWADFCCCCCCC